MKAIEVIREFNRERDWEQFHTPENLAKSISIEAAELLECFQWNNEYDREHLLEELADVYSYVLMMADEVGCDLDEITIHVGETVTLRPYDEWKWKEADVQSKYWNVDASKDWTISGNETASRIASKRGFICSGPVEQFTPNASAPNFSNVTAAVSTSVPNSALPSASKVMVTITGRSQVSLAAIKAALHS